MEPALLTIQPAPHRRHPDWIRSRVAGGERYTVLRDVLRGHRLHTVCEEAKCPNIGECWSHGAATFMVMGDVCTRRCHFCAVGKGLPAPLDPAEPDRVAAAVETLGFDYVVLTSVDRDDMPDQGSAHFAATIEAIHRRRPSCSIEALIPDFRGERDCIAQVAHARLRVLAHNVETVPRLYKPVRPGSVYERSLQVLALAKEICPELLTKSGLMLGLGESDEEVFAVARDLRAHRCDILTLGQYLRPSPNELSVQRYLTPGKFADLRDAALSLGFRHVESGPLVRSSYHAWKQVKQ
jgi:lipoic acid synthetase